jgi:hypothetical protein
VVAAKPDVQPLGILGFPAGFMSGSVLIGPLTGAGGSTPSLGPFHEPLPDDAASVLQSAVTSTHTAGPPFQHGREVAS